MAVRVRIPPPVPTHYNRKNASLIEAPIYGIRLALGRRGARTIVQAEVAGMQQIRILLFLRHGFND